MNEDEVLLTQEEVEQVTEQLNIDVKSICDQMFDIFFLRTKQCQSDFEYINLYSMVLSSFVLTLTVTLIKNIQGIGKSKEAARLTFDSLRKMINDRFDESEGMLFTEPH